MSSFQRRLVVTERALKSPRAVTDISAESKVCSPVDVWTCGLCTHHTLYVLVQLCAVPRLNGLSVPVWRSPSGAQRVSFQKKKKKKMYYHHAALANVIDFSPVWEELKPRRWSKNPSPRTNGRPSLFETSKQYIFFLFS